jgi:hypothetical protein
MANDFERESYEELSGRLGEQIDFLTSFEKFAEAMGNTLGDIIGASTQLNKAFLQNRQRIEEMQYAIADSIPGVMRLGGEIGDISKTIGEIAIASNRNVIANTESVEKLYAATKVLEGATVEGLVNIFADIGVTFDKIGKNVEESISYVQSIGGNANEVMKKVFEDTEKLNQFNFANGVQGLTKMAAKASMLRFDMRETFALAEEALNPERAVELSSAFQRLGVMSGTLSDPFQLMNQSINDPEGLQDSIINMTKQFTYFDEKTKTFKINPQGMLTLREIQKQTGLSASELSKAGLAAAELDARLSSISPKINFSNEEDKQYLANIASMNDKGEYTVSLKDEQGKEYNKRLADVTQEEMDKLIKEQKTGQKPLEEVARNQLTTSQNIENDVKAIRNSLLGGLVTSPQIVKGAEKVGQFASTVSGVASRGDSGIFPVKTIREYGEQGIDLMTKFASDLTSGNKTAVQALQDLTKYGASLFGKIEADVSLGGQKYVDTVIKELSKKGFDTSEIKNLLRDSQKTSTNQSNTQINAIEDLSKKGFDTSEIKNLLQDSQKTSTNQSNIQINEIEDLKYNTSESKVSETKVNYDISGKKRLSQYLSENSQNFEALSAAQSKGMSEMTKQFTDMVNKVQNNQATPAQLNEWIDQNKADMEKYGETYATTMLKYSEDLNKSFQSSTKQTVNIDTKSLETTLVDNVKKYQEEFNSLVKQVSSGEKGTDILLEYVKNNEKGLKDVGSDFHKGMENMAKKMSSSIKNDDKKLSEFNKIVDEIKKGTKTETDLKNYFEKNSKDLERIGVSLDNIKSSDSGTQEKVPKPDEGKSTFIESKRAVSEPVQSGQIQGGQSLTQVIQHKVDFGKINVDVNLTGTVSQFSADTQKLILDKVFNDKRFTDLLDVTTSIKNKDIELSQNAKLGVPTKR